jgi:F-type H+-transporting ATPase subunit b
MEEHLHHAVGPGIKEVLKLANLLVVAFVIYFGARFAIVAFFKERAGLVSKRLVEAKANLIKIQKDLDAAKKEVANFESVKQAMIDQVRVDGEKAAALIIEEANKLASRIVSDAKAAAEDEVRIAGRKLREGLIKESVAAAIAVVQANGEQNLKTHETLVSKAQSEMNTPKGGVS